MIWNVCRRVGGTSRCGGMPKLRAISLETGAALMAMRKMWMRNGYDASPRGDLTRRQQTDAPAAVAGLLFEVLLNATALFNHANINLPRPWTALLRLFLFVISDCTRPPFHRPAPNQLTMASTCLVGACWAPMLPPARPQGMVIGIEQFRTAAILWLDQMLIPAESGAQQVKVNTLDPRQSKQTLLQQDEGPRR